MIATPGIPANDRVVRSSHAAGTWSALICFPVCHRLSKPRNKAKVPNVTTIAGTRPTVTTRPLMIPHPKPTATGQGKRKNNVQIRMCSQSTCRDIGGKTNHRGH